MYGWGNWWRKSFSDQPQVLLFTDFCEKPLWFLLKSRARKWVADCFLLLKRWSPMQFWKHHFCLLPSFVINSKLIPSFQSPWIRFCLADLLVVALFLTWSSKNATYWVWFLSMRPCTVCYFTIPGAGFHAGYGRNCLLGWVYRDVRWVTNQQKSCRQVR